MLVFSLNSSHVGSLPTPSQQQAWPRLPSDQRSKTSKNSNNSTGTVQHNPDRKVSANSIGSHSSRSTTAFRVVNENVAPSRKTSHTSIAQGQNGEKTARPKLRLAVPQHNSILGYKSATPETGFDASLIVNDGTLEEIDLNSSNEALSLKSFLLEDGESRDNEISAVRQNEERRKSTWIDRPLAPRSQTTSPSDLPTSGTETEMGYFKKLVDGLRWQKAKPRGQLSERKERWSLDDYGSGSPARDRTVIGDRPVWHRKASSWTSGGIITLAKPETVTLDQAGAVQKPDRASKFWLFGRSNRSSRTSDAGNRTSIDSTNDIARVADEAALNRAVQRRRILEEMLASEEGYINDLKVLAHVYLTILGSLPQFPRFVQAEVERNLSEILVLHEELLIHMKLFLSEPCSKAAQSPSKHRRSNSSENDSKSGKNGKRDSHKSLRSKESLWFRQNKAQALASEPKEAADIARVFGNMMPRFFIYEEYGARYETMLQLVASTSKTIPNWWAFERGIEALMNSLLPKQHIEERQKKGLTLEDLLIKVRNTSMCLRDTHTKYSLFNEFNQHLYEFIICACSAREEQQWKAELLQPSRTGTAVQAASDPTFLGLRMRDITFVVGRPGSLSWSMSMQRATTVNRRSSASQVIIHNTHSVREGQESPKTSPVTFRRSNSLQSACRIPILAPERSERARLEHVLETVWTKDQLPFPGMATNRGGNFIRASKHTVIRKLSRASSTTQSSSKRSVSSRSLDDPFIEPESEKVKKNTSTSGSAASQYAVHPHLEWDSLPKVFEEDASHEDSIKKVVCRGSRSRGTSDTTIATKDEDIKDGDGTNKLRKPKTLLKVFSTDGIKTWFA
ncbi:uncharacterized protein KY384_001415 [Bacidia gigantensis]|uniref:uncharacterized protein n=1 Tax=Bacidia gigantensis TaxID=2732470 RepID=UPI001D050A92|nr:uncharacterized protein KY384_001415 [Bacidia gigantensis]KAG8533674.1 hypothetical protein KY384_001415 [Bacidia gigantensis]